MKVTTIVLAMLACLTLAACGVDGPGKLPGVPADIQACFRHAANVIPNKALNAAEVEALWKDDRIQGVVLRRCGNRFLNWYNTLRAGWK